MFPLIAVATEHGLRWQADVAPPAPPAPPSASADDAPMLCVASNLDYAIFPRSVLAQCVYGVPVTLDGEPDVMIPLTAAVFGWVLSRVVLLRSRDHHDDATATENALLLAGIAAAESGSLPAWAAEPDEWPVAVDGECPWPDVPQW